MRAHQAEMVVEEDGHIALDELPVRAGDRVMVIVLMPERDGPGEQPYPLRGRQPFHVERPNDPVGDDEWGGGQ